MSNGITVPNTYILKVGELPMKIKKMTIDNICGIKHLDLIFNEGLNLICGENGVGKTTILKAIAYPFIYGDEGFIKKHYGTEKGNIEIQLVNKNGDVECIDQEVIEFVAGSIFKGFGRYEQGNEIIFFQSSRALDYKKIDAITPNLNIECDNNNSYMHSSELLSLGIVNDIKQWFITNYLLSFIEDTLDEYEMSNFELSKNIFNLIDENLSLQKVEKTFEIILQYKNDKIYFEMLSDGYKTCVYILLGLIKEIEYRFPETYVKDFVGIIMIDEIDLHLHPQWQAKLVSVLKKTFPKAQIIATTHSPSVLQNAKKEELIPLYRDQDGDIKIKELFLNEYGLQGWTLEEIMENVMGMTSTNSELYTKTMKEFKNALMKENKEEIIKYYEMLKKMLHPNNTMMQLLEIQVAEWKD